jgi:hypothetical protein
MLARHFTYSYSQHSGHLISETVSRHSERLHWGQTGVGGSDQGQTYALYFILFLLNCVARDSTILSASGRSARRR